MSLRVLRLAAGSALQDEGRPGWRRFGVPPGGAFDRESHRLALALAGRTDGATLEILMMGGEFEATSDLTAAVVGASAPIQVEGRSVPEQSSFRVGRGARLTVGAALRGARVYLAVSSGWSGSKVLESLSNVAPADENFREDSYGTIKPLRLEAPPHSMTEGPLRIMAGPQTRPEDREALESAVLKVSLNSNRLGVRLEGGQFEPAAEFPSEPSAWGAVQLAPSSELLVHGPDGPTLAGYPKIAMVIDADSDRLAQLRPLDEVRFQWVEHDEARRLSSERNRRIERLAASIRMAATA